MNFCGPASLKTIFDMLGISKTEREWAELSGTTHQDGVSIQGLMQAVEQVGYKTTYKTASTIEELKLLIKTNQFVIVNYWRDTVGHFSPIANIVEKEIFIADVYTGNVEKMNLSLFERNWFDFVSYPPQSQKDLLLRELLVIKQ
ncbi:hypothetical protein BH09PAT2_BH09PAT2_05690 [soil metagenome]